MDEQQSPETRERPSLKRRLFRYVVITLTAIVGFLILFSVFLWFIQDKMIFYPRPYSDADIRALDKEKVHRIQFETNQGNQTALYLRPRAVPEDPPDFLWVAFHGNAATAMDWLDYFEDFPDERAGFLLVDYPGYGKSEGKPTPASIREASNAALDALADDLELDVSTLEANLGTIGLSIGSGASLPFAVDHPVDRVVLIAPFTSLKDMAGRVVVFPFTLLLKYNFDNRARIKELLARDDPPEIYIIHGTEDQVIPQFMGRELAAIDPDHIDFISISGADHDWVLDAGKRNILDAMVEDQDE